MFARGAKRGYDWAAHIPPAFDVPPPDFGLCRKQPRMVERAAAAGESAAVENHIAPAPQQRLSPRNPTGAGVARRASGEHSHRRPHPHLHGRLDPSPRRGGLLWQ